MIISLKTVKIHVFERDSNIKIQKFLFVHFFYIFFYFVK